MASQHIVDPTCGVAWDAWNWVPNFSFLSSEYIFTDFTDQHIYDFFFLKEYNPSDLGFNAILMYSGICFKAIIEVGS